MNIKDFYAIPGEKPLDNLVVDGGFCGIFRKIGAIGDSLSSGEFESIDENGTKHYHDCFDFSWGQYMARMAGTEVINFSRGGMTAKEFCQSFGDRHGYFAVDTRCSAYIIALGVNDYYNAGQTLGSVKDVNLKDIKSHPDTIAGWYGELVLRYKEISPDARFFFVSFPKEPNGRDKEQLAFRELLKDFTELFDNSYLIDLYEYAPVYDEEFRQHFYLQGHLNPMGYMLTAKMFCSYIDYIIRHNPQDFKEVGFIEAQFNPKSL